MAKKEKGFEEQVAMLQKIVHQLENEELPLEKGVALYKEGIALVRNCRKKLDQARHEIEILAEGSWESFEVQQGEKNGESDSG